MIPADFRLYDVLRLAAQGADEAVSRRPDEAILVWRSALDALRAGVFAPGTPEAAALGAITGYACPSFAWAPWLPALRDALDAAALAALSAMDGDRNMAAGYLLSASGHAAGLPFADAFTVLLPAIWDQACTEVTA